MMPKTVMTQFNVSSMSKLASYSWILKNFIWKRGLSRIDSHLCLNANIVITLFSPAIIKCNWNKMMIDLFISTSLNIINFVFTSVWLFQLFHIHFKSCFLQNPFVGNQLNDAIQLNSLHHCITFYAICYT